MPLILPGNVASATAATTYSIANSCRFNYADDPYLSFTPSSAMDTKKWTISFWIKKADITESTSGTRVIGFNDGSNEDFVEFFYDPAYDVLKFDAGDGRLVTNRIFRDPAAWYHIVAVWDSANATAGNRMRLYVNGVEETSFATDTNPSLNDDAAIGGTGSPIWIGGDETSRNIKGYLAEIAMCDGQAYAASDFGEFDEDSPTIWKPKDISGLTFGTSGFWLDFEDSSALGNDVSGNNNDFAVTSGLLAVDQATDTPTNNFATLNPLLTSSYTTLSEGNTTSFGNTSTDNGQTSATICPNAGKWYAEVKYRTVVSTSWPRAGMYQIDTDVFGRMLNGNSPGTKNYECSLGSNGTLYYNGTSTSSWGSSLSSGDILNIAVDCDNGACYLGIDGSWQNSGDPTSGASRTGAGVTWTPATQSTGISIGCTDYNGSYCDWNFGNPSYANTSDAADANGYGAFEYAPPSGYLALCTKNLGSDGG